MNIENRRIREFRIKMAALLILRKVLLAATVWGLLWGTVVIVMRAAVGMPRTTLLAGGIALMLAIGWAVVAALRQLPGRTAARASLDKHSASRRANNGGGNRRSWQLEESGIGGSRTSFALAWKGLLGAICRRSFIRLHQFPHTGAVC